MMFRKKEKLFSNPYSSQDVVVVFVVAVVGIGTQKKTELKPKPIEPKNLSSGALALVRFVGCSN